MCGFVQVVVARSERKARYFHLSRSLQKLGRYVGRGKRRSIAQATVENSALQREVVTAIGNIEYKEIKSICSDSHDSIRRMKSTIAVERFTLESVWVEVQTNAPLLVSFLLQLIQPSKEKMKMSS